jgi:hypothetical protein
MRKVQSEWNRELDWAPSGGGQGNANPDVVFGKHAVCLRAERDGRLAQGRTYTITVQAMDASKNITDVNVVVHVPHDQASCPKVPSTRLVDITDPRCTQ